MSDVRAFPPAASSRVVRVGARMALRGARELREGAADAAVGLRRRSVVTYAALLGDRTLALCVRHPEDSLEIGGRIQAPGRSSRPGAQIGLGDLTAVGAPPGCVAGSVRLDGLDREGAASRQVELVGIGQDGQPFALLWRGPAAYSPTCGAWAEGTDVELELTRRRPVTLILGAAPPAAVIAGILGRDDHAVVALERAAGGRAVRLRWRDQVVADLPVTGGGDERRFELRDRDVSIPEGETAELSLAVGDQELPIRRRRRDLRDPGRAVPLPNISGDDGTLVRPALRLVYRPSAQLGVRRLVQPEAANR